MKRSNLVLGASAFVLAIAGAFAGKAAKTTHHVNTFRTQGVQKDPAKSCKVHQVLKNQVTTKGGINQAFTQGNITMYTKNSTTCTHTLFTHAD